jgi:hypothetical protein
MFAAAAKMFVAAANKTLVVVDDVCSSSFSLLDIMLELLKFPG